MKNATRLSIIILLTCLCASADGQAREASALKAAWLYNLGRYSTWPKNAPNTQFVIGVVGQDTFGKHLTAITRKPLHRKKIVIRRFKTAADYTPCHIVFIGPDPNGQMQQQLKDVVAKTKGSPVLLVTDAPGLARQGSMINYSIVAGKVNLEVNQPVVKGAGIKIHPQLLSLSIVRLIK